LMLQMNGGEVDFEEWYGEQHGGLVRTLILVAPSQDLARDCADEAFSRAYAKWERVSTMTNPIGWTYRVAVNVLRRRVRRHRIETTLLQARVPRDVTEDLVIPDEELWAAVRALPERQRLAIALRYVADLTEADVAEAMGVRPGTAAATLSKARAQLSKQVQPSFEVTAWQI
jgi:RNA polymerase sigma factor (sigma-70 family)